MIARTRKLLFALFGLVLSFAIAMSAVLFVRAEDETAPGATDIYMRSSPDSNSRLWTHEMSNFVAGGVLKSATNVGIWKQTLGGMAYAQADYMYKYTTNGTGYAANEKGNYAPQLCNNSNTETSRPNDFAAMIVDIGTNGAYQNAELVFAEDGWGYFEIGAYLDVAPSAVALDAVKDLVTVSYYSGGSWTALESSDLEIGIEYYMQVKDKGELYNINTAALDGNSKNFMTKVRITNAERIEGATEIKLTLNGEEIASAAGAIATSEGTGAAYEIGKRLTNKPVNEFFTVDDFSLFASAPAWNMQLTTNAASAYRSDVYGGGNQEVIASDDPSYAQMEGRISSQGFTMNGKVWAGGAQGDTSYYVGQAVKLNGAEGEQILKFNSAVSGLEFDVATTADRSIDVCDYFKVYAAAENSADDAAWTQLTLRSTAFDYACGHKGFTLSTQSVLENARYIKVVMTTSAPLAAYEPLWYATRVYRSEDKNVVVTGENFTVPGDEGAVTLTAKAYPLTGAQNVSWEIMADGTTAAGAAITQEGVFTSIGNGKAYVRATVDGFASEPYEITVAGDVQSVEVSLETEGTLYIGRAFRVAVASIPAGANVDSVVWSCGENEGTVTPDADDPMSATVVAAGESITIKAVVNGTIEDELAVQNIQPVIDVETVEISTATAYTNLPTNILYMYAPEDATLGNIQLGYTKFEIVSDGTTAAGATIDEFGILRAEGAGNVKVRVTVDNKSVEKVIEVKESNMDLSNGKAVYSAPTTAPEADAVNGFYKVDGGIIADSAASATWSGVKGSDTTAPFDPASLYFYDEEGFNGFAVLFTFLDQDKIGAPATYRQVLGQPHFSIAYSYDGVTFTDVDWAADYVDGYSYTGNVSWPVFRVKNSAPIGGNAKYLRVTLDPQSAPVARAYDPLLVSYKDDDVEMPTVTLYRTAIENGETLQIEGAAETVTGIAEQYIVGRNVNYKASEIAWSVKKNSAETTDASVTAGGVFTATAAGTYTVEATITVGSATASGSFVVEVTAPTPTEITIDSRDSFNNGDNFNFTITVVDQMGNEYLPADLTWTIEQVQKGEGSADFNKLTGNTLTITDQIQMNYFGTLKITVTAGSLSEEKTVTVNKVSQISELKVEGAAEMQAGGKLTLTIVATDQYGEAIESLSTCRWTVEGDGFSRITGSGTTITIDLSDKTNFSGKLTVTVNARMNDLFDFTTVTYDVQVNGGSGGAEEPSGGCSSFVAGSALFGAVALLGGAALIVKKRKK